MRKTLVQFAKFVAVGLLAFAVDYGILVCLVDRFSLNYLAASCIAFCISLCVNYTLSRSWVYESKTTGKKKATEAAAFIITSILGLALNALIMWFGVDVLYANYKLIKFLATGIVMCYNFTVKKLLFKIGEKKQHV